MTFWQSTPYVIIYVVAAGIFTFLLRLSWNLKNTSTVNSFRIVMLSALIWVVGYIFQISSTSLEFKLFIIRIEYAGIIAAVFFWLIFVINYTNYRQLLNKWVIGVLSIIPIVTYFEVLTLTIHNYFYLSYQVEEIKGATLLTKTYGMGFYIWTGYAYLLTMGSLMIVLFKAYSLPKKYRNQILPIAISVFILILPNIFYVSNHNPIYPYDFTNLFIAIVGLIMILSMHFSKFMNMIPVAYNMVVKDAQMGIIIINEQDEILDINSKALSILKQMNHSAIGRQLIYIFPQYEPYARENLDKGDLKTEVVLGDKLAFEMKITSFMNQGSESGKIISLWEITEYKTLLADLDAYAHTVAHDLKASANQVVALSDLLSTNELSEAERTKMVEYLGTAGRNMSKIIDELLKLARTRNVDEEKYELIDISETVHNVLSRIDQAKYSAANLKLPEKWPELPVNKVWIEEIWYNLLTNAYKYGKGMIEIDWRPVEGGTEFWVKDNGPGVNKNKLTTIFNAMHTGGPEAGHGLGLSIVKGIVDKLGGNVWVKSKPGKGSTFFFSLPITTDTD